MALTVVWEKISLDREGKDALILNRGETLPDWVSDFVRATLVMIGAVKDYAVPVQVVEAAVEEEKARGEEVPPPVLPAEVPPPTVVAPAAPDPVERPAVSDNKDAWEAYAVYRGYATQTEAESMTKAKLVAMVNDREKV